MRKELKREIKEDEFVSWVEKLIAWGDSHRDELRIGIGVTVVLLAAFGALTYFQSHRAAEAERAFEDALEAFEAPVAGELAEGADRPTGQVFATSDDKYKTAAAAFEGVGRRYGSSEIGLKARYYGALCRIELGQYDEAEKTLREVLAQSGEGLVGDLARLAFGNLYRKSGQTDRAVEAYKTAAETNTNMPRDEALNCLAGALEDAERWTEARAAYRELVEDYPASVYAPNARARVQYLETTPKAEG